MMMELGSPSRRRISSLKERSTDSVRCRAAWATKLPTPLRRSILPAARTVSSACLAVMRLTLNCSASWASEGTALPGGSVAHWAVSQSLIS